MPSRLTTLAQWLSGEFDNQPQALDQPAWFAHLRLWQRPLPHRIQGNLALFAEQANVLYPDQPYRQRVMLLQETDQGMQATYLALKHPSQFQRAGANPVLLKALNWDNLDPLPGCVLHITPQLDMFEAQPPAGATCYFQYDGKTRQVVLGFEVSSTKFYSYDRGVDPDTGQGLWGALLGPYEFNKRQDYAAELPS